MRRLIPVAVAVVALGVGGAAYAMHTPDTTVACADISSAGFSFDGGVVTGSIAINDGLTNSCTTVTYTLHVTYSNPGGKVFTKTESIQGDGTSPLVEGYSVRVPGFLTLVETFVTSTDASGAVLDRGPNTGTIPVAEGSGAGSGYE
jgi:hypothetical protein